MPRNFSSLIIERSFELENPMSFRKSTPNASGSAAFYMASRIACRFFVEGILGTSVSMLLPRLYPFAKLRSGNVRHDEHLRGAGHEHSG